jgi:hypothetical protein
VTARKSPQSANPDAAILSERQRLLLRAIWTWEHDTYAQALSALPREVVVLSNGTTLETAGSTTYIVARDMGDLEEHRAELAARAERGEIVVAPSRRELEEQQLAVSQVRHDYSVSPVPEYLLLAQFHGHFPIQRELRALAKLGLVEHARTRGITEGCWRIGGHFFELHTHEQHAPKLCVDAYLDGRRYCSYLGLPDKFMERGWTLTAAGLRLGAELDAADAGATMPHTRKRPGRKPKYDSAADEQMHRDLESSQSTVSQFAKDRGLKADDVQRAIDRVRARRNREKRAAK